jgi:hypothetical protein
MPGGNSCCRRRILSFTPLRRGSQMIPIGPGPLRPQNRQRPAHTRGWSTGHASAGHASCRARAWRAQSRDTSQDCRDDPPGQRPIRRLGLRPRPRQRGRRGHTRPPRRVPPGCVHHLFGVRSVGNWRSRCWRSDGAARRFGRCRCGPSVRGARHTGVWPCNRSP